jgi:ADP-ribose pyrophosphatase YjhB (NUDIX family)
MEEKDISIKTPAGRFNYRVGAIIMKDDKILMVKNSNSPYYYSVGGRVKFGESSQKAILREVFEETQTNFEIDRLAFIHENFFVWEIENEPFHEISLFFLMKPNKAIDEIKCNTFGENLGEESLHWLPVSELEEIHLYPDFFKTDLKCLPRVVMHYITKDGKTFRCS